MARPSIICYADRRKSYSVRLAQAFAEGCGGSVALDWVPRDADIAVVHGLKDESQHLLRHHKVWYQIDHGYFGRLAYHRVTRNGLWTDGLGPPRHDRLEMFDIKFGKARVNRNGNLLAALQTPWAYSYYRLTTERWLSMVGRRMRRYSRRDVLIRYKSVGRFANQPPIQKQFPDCWLVAVHSSGSALDALAWGLPVLVTEQRYPAALLGTDYEHIEQPRYPSIEERRDLFARLAAQQWTVEEMASGQCWRELNDGDR